MEVGRCEGRLWDIGCYWVRPRSLFAMILPLAHHPVCIDVVIYSTSYGQKLIDVKKKQGLYFSTLKNGIAWPQYMSFVVFNYKGVE